MKALLLAGLLVLAPLAIASPATACPDDCNPQDPPPMSLCPAPPKVTTDPVRWLYCKVVG